MKPRKINAMLIGVNAKYIQSNLAIRYLQKYARERGVAVTLLEITIHQPIQQSLAEIYYKKPDVIGFSCYIWNIEYICALLRDIKAVLPEVLVVVGGPEVGYCPTEFLEANPAVNYVISGQGEAVFYRLLKHIEAGTPLHTLAGITARSGTGFCVNPPEHFPFADTPFPYDAEDFHALKGRILYYETQRGCPFRCSYCLSSEDTGVEFLPLARVYRELDIFLAAGVRQVKLVDRTFNCNAAHRRAIWRYLIDNDNHVTNFHFEISADILADEDFDLLAEARAGLFQFEIGVQSTHAETLAEIDRRAAFSAIAENVRRLWALGTIHLHLDLIAGLPYENFASFRRSFNDVFALGPGMLQLGFLKLLKGSKMARQAARYGMKYSSTPPYEVFSTDCISYEEMLSLKLVEQMLESYYNSALATTAVRCMLADFETAFDFFYALGQFWQQKNYGTIQHSKMKMFERLFEFAEGSGRIATGRLPLIKEALVFDILRNDNIKKIPERLLWETTAQEKQAMDEVYHDPIRLSALDARLASMEKRTRRRQTNIVCFHYDMLGDFVPGRQMILFHYLGEGARGTALALS